MLDAMLPEFGEKPTSPQLRVPAADSVVVVLALAVDEVDDEARVLDVDDTDDDGPLVELDAPFRVVDEGETARRPVEGSVVSGVTSMAGTPVRVVVSSGMVTSSSPPRPQAATTVSAAVNPSVSPTRRLGAAATS
jgi:tRNA-binding EMAP/Myf-like protein